MDHVQEKGAVNLVISKNGGEKAVICQVFCGEAVDQQPMEHPGHGLGEFLITSANQGVPLTESLLDKFLHLFERGVLNNISSLSVENLASKKSPEHLKHELRVLLALVDQDLLKREKQFFRIYKKDKNTLKTYLCICLVRIKFWRNSGAFGSQRW